VHEARQAYEKEILSRGESVAPILESLFRTEQEYYYRGTVIHLLFELPNNKEGAMQFVLTQAAQPASEWGEAGWTRQALRQMESLDPQKARQLALRVAEASDEWLIISSALGVLERIGRTDDLPPLKKIEAEFVIKAREQARMP
jgi:hypothetical protein